VIDLTQEDEPAPVPQPATVADPLELRTNVSPTSDRFRLQAKFFFITWPQCNTPKETVLERIQDLPDYSHAVVSREDHHEEDGEHLHAFIAFTRQQNKRGFEWLDALAGQHGNYQRAKDPKASVRYVIKDGEYVFDGFDPVEFSATPKPRNRKGPSTFTVAASLIRDESKELDDIDTLMPGFVLSNKRKIQEYISYQQVKRMKANLQPWLAPDLSTFPAADFNYKIAKWVAENVKQPRAFKQKQLFIWSDGPNAGKTELVNQLSKMLSVYHLPKTLYVDGYQSNYFDLVVVDEFKSHFTIQFLNEFLQGSTMHCNQKGSGTVKSDNPPCILLSNYSLEDCYTKKQSTAAFEALKCRLKIVKVPKGQIIDVYHTLPQK